MSLIEFTPDTDVVAEALTWPEQATELRVVDVATYEHAAGMLLGIKDLRKRIAETFDSHIDRAHKAHKALVAEKQNAEAPLKDAETIIKRSLGAYDAEQERIRHEAERLAQIQARKDAETRAIAEAAALEREAHATGDADMLAEAHEIIAAPIVVPTVSIPKATPKVAGIAYSETWSAEVTDLHALVCYVAQHPQYLPLLSANMPTLNGQARSLKAHLRIPGVKPVCTKGVRAGGAR